MIDLQKEFKDRKISVKFGLDYYSSTPIFKIMNIENWSDIIPTFVKVPLKAYKYRHSIQKWWKRFLVFTDKGDTNIVVLGRPSVGKSVMAAYLYGETNNLSWELPQTSKDVEAKALTLGDWTHIFRVIPGQTMNERYRGLNEAFNSSTNLEGIIYIADWGFTDVRDQTIKEYMVKEKGITTIHKLRAFNLERELEDFKNICTEIEKAFAIGKAPKWLLIVVNKADLFFDDIKLNKAQAYYHQKGESEFSQILQNLLMRVGEQRLKCAAIPLCSYEKELSWNSKVIQTQMKGEENRKALLANFYSTIANF